MLGSDCDQFLDLLDGLPLALVQAASTSRKKHERNNIHTDI